MLVTLQFLKTLQVVLIYFLNICLGCTRDDEAQYLLEACENNLQVAVEFYLQNRARNEHGNSTVAGPSTSRNLPTQRRARENMEVDDDDV